LIKGVVLAGGEGKRLRPLTYYFQKCMIPIGHSQKPLLEYIIRLFKYNRISNILVLTGYKKEQITNYFNSGDRFGVQLNYVLDNPDLKGTGGAILNAYQCGAIEPDTDLLIYYGDIISTIDLNEMLEQHRKKCATATLALSRGLQVSVGVAEIKNGAVIGWTEKPKFEIDVGMGIVFLKTTAIHELERLNQHHNDLDIMTHLIPHLIKKGMLVNAYSTDAFWYDVGSVERYEKLDNSAIESRLEYLFQNKKNYE